MFSSQNLRRIARHSSSALLDASVHLRAQSSSNAAARLSSSMPAWIGSHVKTKSLDLQRTISTSTHSLATPKPTAALSSSLPMRSPLTLSSAVSVSSPFTLLNGANPIVPIRSMHGGRPNYGPGMYGAPQQPQAGEFLKKFCVDLTQQAREHKLDPVIGREDEIRRTIEVLSRRRKNNPVLIGTFLLACLSVCLSCLRLHRDLL